MKKAFLLCLVALFWANVFAQEQKLLSLGLEVRGDYQREYVEDELAYDATGFKGNYINLRADGSIGGGFSYSYCQSLNKTSDDATFFDATDWLYVAYKKNNWEFTAGKLVVAVGGFEYDAAPIDLYFCSEWWHNIPCYQFGASAGYLFNDGKDRLLLQVCESPWRVVTSVNDAGETVKITQDEMYAYNLMWTSSHGSLNTIYTLNMMEYLPGHYISYISLGNRFNMEHCAVELDLMNRATSGQAFLGKNYSVIGKVEWRPTDKLKVFGKASYDVNNTGTGKDYLVADGCEITRVGAGVEYFPLEGSKDVRLHAAGSYSFGDSGTVLLDKQTYLTVGVTWKMNLLSFNK